MLVQHVFTAIKVYVRLELGLGFSVRVECNCRSRGGVHRVRFGLWVEQQVGGQDWVYMKIKARLTSYG